MALRIASFFGVGCLSQPWLALGEKEFFPLSGGIDNGVQVTIKVSKIIDGEEPVIEFVNRERKAAFRFELDVTSQLISRSAPGFNTEPAETFGGWPGINANGETTFVFTKRKFGMAVTIDGTRYPWYDFAGTSENNEFPLLTHVAVHSGFENPEVTLERPECQHACLPDECRDADGKVQCENGACNATKVVQMGGSLGVATQCKALAEPQAGGSMHCCDGAAAPPKGMNLEVASWATLTSSSYMEVVCTAFSISPCPTAYAGQLVQIRNMTSGTYRVWNPSSMTEKTVPGDEWALPESSFLSGLPAFAMFKAYEDADTKTTLSLPNRPTSRQFTADAFWDVVLVPEGSRGQFVGYINWWYLYQRTTKFNRVIRDFIPFIDNSSVVHMTAIKPEANLDCDDLALEDSNGNDCTWYTTNNYCTKHGYPTRAGCAVFHDSKPNNESNACTMPGGFDIEGGGRVNLGNNAAALQCCHCGGGALKPPASWGPQIEVVM